MTTREIVVFDSPYPCSYLPGRTARMPHRHPVARLSPDEFDDRLAAGDRRAGILLYRAECPACQACQPIRLDLTTFRPNATQRREQRRGDAIITQRRGRPIVDEARVELFNRHRVLRGLEHGDEPLNLDGYAEFLANSCCETWELTYWHAGRLVGVAIVDVGRQSLSAVYTYYDPQVPGVSLGTYSVLREVALCRQTGRRYLYLGFYIAESPHMAYKGRYHPHERLIGGIWRPFK
ncbi:MAG: arginyltransferase [Pirellulaceae bacterium]|nr:arginyltransferase [Pirellulaceae bacterium]